MIAPNGDALAMRLSTQRRGIQSLLASPAELWLGRPFAPSARPPRRKALLVYQRDRLALAQTYPFLHYAKRMADAGWAFRAVPADRLRVADLPPDLALVLFQSGYTPDEDELERPLAALASHCPDARIAYLDWFAPVDIRFAARVAPYVHAYVKKAALRDRAAYRVAPIGHTWLSDHYCARFGLDNPPPDWAPAPDDMIDRLLVGPAFSTTPGLLEAFETDRMPPAGERPIDLHARLAIKGTPWYQAMRTEARDAVTKHFSDLAVRAEGWVSRQDFMAELTRSSLCFSPFGYGEICWRDVEAVQAGAVLVKPDMGHLDCRPDIYRPFETYIPVRWDLADLDERVRTALADPAGLRRMALAAHKVVKEHLAGPALTDLLQSIAGQPPLPTRP